MGRSRERKMPSSGEGIQQLMQAEKKAAELVSQARKAKGHRLKEAEKECQSFAAQTLGSNDSEMAKLSASTDAELKAIDSQVKSNQAAVIKMMIGYITDVKLEA